MKKRLIIRSLIGLVVGALAVHAITLFVNYISRGEILICMPELIEKLGLTKAIIVQTVLGALIGIIAIGGTVLFDIETWSLLRATVAHCALILFSYLSVGMLLNWFSFHIIPILIMTGGTIIAYALVWLIMYAIWKAEIRNMNRLTEEYKKDIEASEDQFS